MTTGATDPITYPEAYNQIRLGGVLSPGFCKVSEFKRLHTIDKKTGKGSVGSTTTFVGKPVIAGTIKFHLWDNGTLGTGHNHFAEWDNFRPLFKYDPTKRAMNAVDIYHPVLDDIEVTSVVCEELGSLVDEGQGMWSITVKLCEYSPPPKISAVSTPTGSVSNSTGASGPSGNAAIAAGTQPDPAVVALQKQADALAKQAGQP